MPLGQLNKVMNETIHQFSIPILFCLVLWGIKLGVLADIWQEVWHARGHQIAAHIADMDSTISLACRV